MSADLRENLPARDLVVRRVRHAILSGRFRPGQRLVERELVALTGVSRTPVREAIRMLEQTGLLTTAPYRGPVVAMPDLADAQHLFEVRAALEGRAVALFTAHAPQGAVERLRGHLRAAERGLATGRLRTVLAANNTFHDELASGCGNPLLESMITNLRDRIVLLRVQSLSYPGRPPRSVAEHRAIVRMIDRGDDAGAQRLLEQHIMRAWRAARAQLLRSRRRGVDA